MVKVGSWSTKPLYESACDDCGEKFGNTSIDGRVYLIARNHSRRTGHHTFVRKITETYFDPSES